jgi:tetratricopeptide (TPR) repeat protein
MAARPLHEAVQQAEEAISGGNYRAAVETCRRVLGQFPEFATAHRLLGEALLEEGDSDGAERAYAEALQRDPQSSAAYTGLSKIAEGRGDQDNALAYAQVAWEIMPQRADLRERVAGLSEELYGKGGRLHLTRAALTSLHFRAGRWSRAAAEAAAVLGEQPDRVDVQLRMAESLWRRGSLTAAGNACRSVLASSPSAVMALLMLADVERRQNNQDGAAQLLGQARQIDPDGVCAADLVTIGSPDLAEFILPSSEAVLDESADGTSEIERPRIAPAPDFAWPEAPAEASRSVAAQVPETEAEGAEMAASAAAASGYDVSLPDDAEIEAARPPAQAQPGYTSMLRSLEGEGLRPFRLDGEPEDEPIEAFEPADAEAKDDNVFSLVSDEEIEAARPPADAPRGFTTLLNSLDNTGLEPFQVEGQAPDATHQSEAVSSTEKTDELKSVSPVEVPEERAAAMPAEAEAATPEVGDYSSYLTAGWDNIDAEIQRAIPTDDAWKGYTGQLRALDETGLKPFSIENVDEVDADPSAQAQVEESEPDLSSYEGDLSFLNEVGLESAPTAHVESNPVELDSDLTEGWNMIDDEIQNAIPSDSVSGYTDELKALGLSGVEPFSIADDEKETEAEDEMVGTAASPRANDVVPNDLVADIDLWTFDDAATPASTENVAAPVTDEMDDIFGEPTDDKNVTTRGASDLDLFDLADLEAPESATEPTTEVSAEAEPFDLSELEPEAIAVEGANVVSDELQPFDFSEFESATTAVGADDALESVDMSELQEVTTDDESMLSVAEPVDTLQSESFVTDSENPIDDAADTSVAEAEAASAESADALDAPVDVPVDLSAWRDIPEQSPADAVLDAVSIHPVHAVEVSASDGVRMTIEHLGVDAALFGRVRDAKAQLMESGQIQGNQLLPGVEPPGPTLEDLERMAAENPNDVATRRQFAAALTEAEDHGRALSEYHSMFTSQLPLEEDDLSNLSRVAEKGEHAVKGNQLLGAIHRRAENYQLSAKYYRQSLIAHRDNARKEA